MTLTPNDKWSVSEGEVQAVVSYGEFSPKGEEAYTSVGGFDETDYYKQINVSSWIEEPGLAKPGIDKLPGIARWSGDTSSGAHYASPDGLVAFHYYMFIFDTVGDIDGVLSFSGAYAEILYDGTPNGVPAIQKGVIIEKDMVDNNLYLDALVVRFDLSTVVPERPPPR